MSSDFQRPFRLDVAHKRTKLDVSVRHLDAVETGNGIDVDEQRGAAQPHVESRDEALAAGEKLCVIILQERDRMRNGSCLGISKRRRLQRTPPERISYLLLSGAGRVNPSLRVGDW